MKHFIADGLRKLEAMLGEFNGEFSFGDQPTMADLCLVPQVYNARRWGVDMADFQRIVDIDGKMRQITGVPDRASGPRQTVTEDANPKEIRGRRGSPLRASPRQFGLNAVFCD